MKFNLRDFLLKMIPYVLSIAGGLVLFIVTKDDIHDPSVTDLINNIAASLLSIPLVFLLYDYSNYRVSKQLKKTLANNMGDKISVLLLKLIMVIRQIIGEEVSANWKNGLNYDELARKEIAAQTQAWLDNNLPAVVERIVKQEIERVMAKVGSKD